MTAALRRLLASPGAALFALALASYAYFYQAGGWNQNTRFAMVRAAVEEGSARIDRYHRATGDKSKRDGHYYSDKAPGASWLGIPAYAAARALVDDEPRGASSDRAAYAVTVWAIALPSAAAVAALFGLLGLLGVATGARLAASLAYGFGTLAFPFATLLYGHQLTAALVLIGLYALVRGCRRGEPSAAELAASGLVFGCAIAVEYPTALAVIPCLLYAAWRVRPRARLVWIALGLAAPGLAVAAYHAIAFGGPLTLPYEFSTQPHRHQGAFMGLGVPSAEALREITVSGYRGLWFSAPWLALAAPGLALWWRRGRRAEAALCAAVPALFLWMNASLVDWQGGWTFGPRYLIAAIPFLAIGAAGLGLAPPPPWARRALWAIALVLVVWSVAMMVVATAVKPEVPVYVDRPFGDYLWPRFSAGDLAVSTQSIDSPSAPEGGPRYAWNWGQVIGLRGLASLAPLAVLWAAGAAWLARAVRPEKER